ncbi:MAG: LytTR family DNA-binding domain-containing protein [Pseudomonadota bacterium]|nr:LytTR family DNA-binding domain-containing protein [Pseudomonadota bacterium]
MRVLIVDDEPLARRRLVQLLATLPDILIAGEAEGGREALELVELLRPDVLLLDIEMPVVDGFAVLRSLPPGPTPAIIFVTAFQDHAVKAFELRATDFVVKPVSGDRLAKAIEQARSDLDARRAGERLAFLQSRLAELESRALSISEPGLWVQIGSDKRRLALADIRWLQAERDYVRVHMDGHTHLVNAMLGEIEKALDKQAFLRIHRSSIVQKDKVRAILRGRFSAPVLELDDGQRLPVGRKYRDAVRSAFDQPILPDSNGEADSRR